MHCGIGVYFTFPTPSARGPDSACAAASERADAHACLAGTIGITSYAAKALGDVVYVELPTADTSVAAGDTIGAVESVKSASDILSPVAGTVVEANAALEETPGLINRSPEGEAWIARVKVESVEEVDGLMGEDEYRAFVEE